MFDFENSSETLSGELRVLLTNPNPTPSSSEELTNICGFAVFLVPSSLTVSVRWSITDQNDSPPMFQETRYNLSVLENQRTLVRIFSFSASDLDTEDSAALSYTITSGNVGGTFALEANNLVLVRRLDFEMRQSYSLSVQVADDGIHTRSSCLRCSTTLQVSVQDVDDEPPVFSSPAYSSAVVEMAEVGTIVLTVLARDSDTPTVTYRLSREADGIFWISPLGVITVSGELDREGISS